MTESNSSVSTNKRARVKILVLPAIVLLPSLYYSFSFTTGIVVGYVVCKIFCHLFLSNGKIDSIFVDFGKWKFHLHHWIIGLVALAIVWIIDFFYVPTFLAGFICGIIIQDIYDYNDWYKVISINYNLKKEKIA